MHKLQLELLLNQMYDCSMAIYAAIEKEDMQEVENLIAIKAEKMKLIDTNKKFLQDKFSLFDVMVEQIKRQENINLKLLQEKCGSLYKKYRGSVQKSKILNKYSPSLQQSGSIVDMRE